MGTPNEGGGKAPEAAKAGPSTAPVAPTTAPAGVAGTGSVSASAIGQSREMVEWGNGSGPGAPTAPGAEAPNDSSATSAPPPGPAPDALGVTGSSQDNGAWQDNSAAQAAEGAKAAAEVREVAEAYMVKAKDASAEPKPKDTEKAVLLTFDALPLESRKGLLLGKPDAEGTKLLRRIAKLMESNLATMNDMQARDRGKKAQKLRPLAGTGLRDRKHQAKLFFDKVMSTGGRPGFWTDEPIYVDPETDAVVDGPDKGRRLEEDEWRQPKYVGIRVDRALKYSALPSVSRHHWGTDVDVQSVTSKDWKAGGEGTPEGPYHQLSLWLEANRDVLPLKTTFSGERHGGYLDEEWHLSMGELGPAMHARFNELVSNDELKASIMEAFRAWAAKNMPPKVIRAETEKALAAKLDDTRLADYVDGVNPDIAPKDEE